MSQASRTAGSFESSRAVKTASCHGGASFITWYPSCRRSDTLAAWLGGRSHLIHYLDFKRPLHAPVKYVLQTCVTWWRLWRERPAVVLVASPPIVAAVAVRIYARCFDVPYVIDAHTGVFDDRRWTWLSTATRWLSRGAAATIVTSDTLAARVRGWGATAVVIGDVPVAFPDADPADLGPGFHVVVVNTFSEDEPIGEVIEAARALPGCRFHVTGNPRHARNRWTGDTPPNVKMTGWLSEEAYGRLLRAANVVVCLTTHDLTMQRGGYEAVALERPLITSDWPLLRETFHRGTIHVDNTKRGIESAIQAVRERANELQCEMRALHAERVEVFRSAVAALEGIIRQQGERADR
jgi:glycosyltransferase involved in cell wall biosynthesis